MGDNNGTSSDMPAIAEHPLGAEHTAEHSIIHEATGGRAVPENITCDSKSGSNADEDVPNQHLSSVAHEVNYEESYQTDHPDKTTGLGENIGVDVSHKAPNPGYPADYCFNGSVAENASYQSTNVSENGTALNDSGMADAGHLYDDAMYSAEEERLWNTVRINSLDFNSWVALIEETEKVAEVNILKIRRVYDAFLSEFPLCFGYWKKYADHEGRLDSIEKVVEVYERAVQAVTYSVDMWVNYCQFAISTYDDPDIIRRLFERGLAYVGTDYRSDILWDEYIRYEESQQAWSHVAMIYTRILEHPIQQLDRYYNCFKELTSTRHLSELCTAEEAAMFSVPAENSNGVVETETGPDGEVQIANTSSTEEDLKKYISVREEMYKKAKEYDSKIIGYETAIRRPYFHARPLDIPELENWHHYLDFIERQDDFNKVIKLYERCVIACANYPEIWIRYVLCMEASGSLELANNALARATQVFVKKHPEMHIFAARFKEVSGDIEGARAEYQHLYLELSPGLLEAVVKHANMEYRLGNQESAFSVFDKAIEAEQLKEHSKILPMLLVQYSRFLSLVAGDLSKAKSILDGSLTQVQLSRHTLEAIIHLESISPSDKRIEYLDSLVDKFITPDPYDSAATASTSDREDISSIFLEFLDLFGDAESIKRAHNRHALLFLRQRSAIILSKKRGADDSLLSERDKVAKTGDPASDPTAHGQKAQVWPTTSQAQGQQWSAGYASQASYSAYGSYPNYAPQAVPQGAAYGVYPTPYPAQAYPQQSYGQPAAAPAVATPAVASAAAAVAAPYPPQPAAAVPQTYYPTYY